MRNNHVVIMAGGVDSRSCDFLLSDEGKDAITQLHVDGILSYVRACE